MSGLSTVNDVYIGLPAFNEELAIEPLFERIRLTKNDLLQRNGVSQLIVLIYDDGSTDATADKVRQHSTGLDVCLLSPGENGGLGVALRGLFTEFLAQAKDDDLLIVMDTDDTHDPCQIVDLLDSMDKYGYDVVIASRYRRGSKTMGVPAYRQVLSFGFAGLVKFLLPIKNVRDYSCGYRSYTYAAVEALDESNGFPLQESGFAAMPEILIRLRGKSFRFGEIPLRLSYDRRLTVSKMRAWQNSRRLLNRILSWRFNSPRLGEEPWAGPSTRTWWESERVNQE